MSMPDWLSEVPEVLRAIAKRRRISIDQLGKLVACGELQLAKDVEAARDLGTEALNDALFLHRLSIVASTANMIAMLERQAQAKDSRADL